MLLKVLASTITDYYDLLCLISVKWKHVLPPEVWRLYQGDTEVYQAGRK